VCVCVCVCVCACACVCVCVHVHTTRWGDAPVPPSRLARSPSCRPLAGPPFGHCSDRRRGYLAPLARECVVVREHARTRTRTHTCACGHADAEHTGQHATYDTPVPTEGHLLAPAANKASRALVCATLLPTTSPARAREFAARCGPAHEACARLSCACQRPRTLPPRKLRRAHSSATPRGAGGSRGGTRTPPAAPPHPRAAAATASTTPAAAGPLRMASARSARTQLSEILEISEFCGKAVGR